MTSKPGLLARLLNRGNKAPVVTTLAAAVLNQPLLVQPAIGEALVGGYLEGKITSADSELRADRFEVTGSTGDSRQRYMRVVNSTVLTGTSASGSVVLPAGQYAQIVPIPAYRWMGNQATPSSNWMWACSASLITSSATGCTVASQNTGEGSYAPWAAPAPVASSNQMQIITVDVSGY